MYVLISDNDGNSNKLFLDEEQSLALDRAREGLKHISDMEHLYDHVFETFTEFKVCLYECNLRFLEESSSRRSEMVKGQEVRSKLNRKVLNLLNFSKLYLDKHYRAGKGKSESSSYVQKLTGCDESHKKVELQYNEVGESNDDYILGCILRNFAQHSTLPVDSLTSGASRKENGIVYSFYTPVDIESVKRNSNNLTRFQRETLGRFSETVDLHSILDGYVYAISQFHHLNRTLTKSSITAFKKVYDDLQCAADGKQLCDSSLWLFKAENGEATNLISTLGYEWFSVVDHLMKKHHRIVDWDKIEFSEYAKK